MALVPQELAYRTICSRFLEAGLLVGDIDALMAANIGSFFMPHGLGHLIGLVRLLSLCRRRPRSYALSLSNH